jgi:hypothetical protein
LEKRHIDTHTEVLGATTHRERESEIECLREKREAKADLIPIKVMSAEKVQMALETLNPFGILDSSAE